jgi:hypothetical protein
MKKMGKYCKAYEIGKLMEFPGWAEKVKNRDSQVSADGETANEQAPGDFYYLQENYTVTDGIFLDEDVVFDDVTPEWIEFCRNTLKFEVLNYESSQA